MSTIPYVVEQTSYNGEKVAAVKWPGMQNGDVGQPFECPHRADKSVHVEGTFGVGGLCKIMGSNMYSSPTFRQLKNQANDLIEFATAGPIETILPNVYWLRPEITAGDGSTALDVYVLMGD